MHGVKPSMLPSLSKKWLIPLCRRPEVIPRWPACLFAALSPHKRNKSVLHQVLFQHRFLLADPLDDDNKINEENGQGDEPRRTAPCLSPSVPCEPPPSATGKRSPAAPPRRADRPAGTRPPRPGEPTGRMIHPKRKFSPARTPPTKNISPRQAITRFCSTCRSLALSRFFSSSGVSQQHHHAGKKHGNEQNAHQQLPVPIPQRPRRQEAQQAHRHRAEDEFAHCLEKQLLCHATARLLYLRPPVRKAAYLSADPWATLTLRTF